MFRESVFILHSRRYSDSRLILDCLGGSIGRFSIFVRVSKSKKSPAHIPQPFIAYSAQLKPSPKSGYFAQSLEQIGAPHILTGKQLFCAMYMNEILVKTLAQGDGCPLYNHYVQALTDLAGRQFTPAGSEPVLRRFELALFQEAGFEIDFSRDLSGKKIQYSGQVKYTYIVGKGFADEVWIDQNSAYKTRQKPIGCSGLDIQALQQGIYENEDVLRLAKQIHGALARYMLSGKPLNVLKLFKAGSTTKTD